MTLIISENNGRKDYYTREHSYMDMEDTNYTNNLVETLLSIDLNKNHKILEIGCGRGRFSFQLLKRGYKLYCIDISEMMINQFKDQLTDNEGVELITADFNDFCDMHPNEFDAVIGFYILHHFDNLKDSLANIRYVLKNNSTVAFIEPNPYNPMYYVQILMFKDMNWEGEKGILNMTFNKLSNAFSFADFKNFGLKRFGSLPPFLMNASFGLKLDSVFSNVMPSFIKPYQLITAEVDK